jgi:hypothetical protein
MTGSIRRWHRFLVDRIAESRWLWSRSGSRAAWAHYERHARAQTAAADRHARVRDQAAARARRWAHHGPPRVLPRWQAAAGRIFRAGNPREGQDK